MYPTENGGIVLERWREFNALKAGLDHHENPGMSERLIATFDETLAQETLRQQRRPIFEILPEDLPIVREACEETLATKGLLGAYTRFVGIKRSARQLLTIANTLPVVE